MMYAFALPIAIVCRQVGPQRDKKRRVKSYAPVLEDAAATGWGDDKVPRHGAALAYYTVLSLVPLLVVIIAMIGLLFGREAAQGYILEQIGSLVGPQSAEAIKEMN